MSGRSSGLLVDFLGVHQLVLISIVRVSVVASMSANRYTDWS